MKKFIPLLFIFSSCAHIPIGTEVRAYGKYIRNCTGTISPLDPGKWCAPHARYAILVDSCELRFPKGWEGGDLANGLTICVEEVYPIHRMEYRK